MLPTRRRTPPPPPGLSSGGGGKSGGKGGGGGNPRKDRSGRYMTNREGLRLCFDYSKGTCSNAVCPKGFVHQCQKCLGSHPMKDCPQT